MAENEEVEGVEGNNDQVQEDIVKGTPRSIECRERVFLRFVNFTNRCIEVVWVNYRGTCERYILLREIHHYVDVNTFETHPWIARDQCNKDLMLIDGKPIYYPRKMERTPIVQDRPNPNESLLRNPVIPMDRRYVLKITLSMYSLRERCLLEIGNHLRSVADVAALHLPNRLSVDLRALVTQKERQRSSPMHLFR